VSAISDAIRELERERDRIDAALRSLRSFAAVSPAANARRTRVISEEGRQRIAEAQRKRWAKTRSDHARSKAKK
jgi:hypothetical protein